MQPGQTVQVLDFKGEKLSRRIVELIGDVVLVCKDEEYEIAKRKRKLPWCVGFHKKFVLTK